MKCAWFNSDYPMRANSGEMKDTKRCLFVSLEYRHTNGGACLQAKHRELGGWPAFPFVRTLKTNRSPDRRLCLGCSCEAKDSARGRLTMIGIGVNPPANPASARRPVNQKNRRWRASNRIPSAPEFNSQTRATHSFDVLIIWCEASAGHSTSAAMDGRRRTESLSGLLDQTSIPASRQRQLCGLHFLSAA